MFALCIIELPLSSYYSFSSLRSHAFLNLIYTLLSNLIHPLLLSMGMVIYLICAMDRLRYDRLRDRLFVFFVLLLSSVILYILLYLYIIIIIVYL